MAQHFSNLQTVTGEKAIAHKVTDSVTLGDAKVKNSNAPLRAIAHNPTDTTPSVCWNFSPKCWNFSPKCWNFETWLKKITPPFPESLATLIWRSP
ncbi:hypothetical protein AP9108_22085 [Arthrospira sp. PCC 9108]|nr:hypothetical protein AP9108_22085 [Arthrospira sp. PCC 9108]